MAIGWADGPKTLKAAAAATLLMLAGASIAQEPAAAPAATTAASATVAVAAPTAPAAIAHPVSGAAVTPGAPAPALAVPPADAGYERTAPTANIGQPVPRGIAVQEQFTPTGHQARAMLDYVLNPVIAFITALVLLLMTWCILRYRAGANPVPSTRAHNFTIEVIWTVVPALILLAIAFPSFRLLAKQYFPPKADLTVKVTGYQWYWGYEYPDYGGISFDSLPLSKEDAEKAGEPYLLEVDNRLVVPAGAVVKVLVTAADVIHSFAVPSFWVKMDAIPGRINETWFKVDRPGVYYGQCSELCGVKHSFMPIAVEVKSPEDFRRWVRMKQAADGIEPTGPGIAAAPVPVAPAAAGAAPSAAPPPAAVTAAAAAPAAAPASAPAA